MSISRLSEVLQINYDVPKGIHELYSLLEKGLQDDRSGDVVSFREGLDTIRSEIND